MDDEIETLMVDVRASTAGFRSDIETMRGALDSGLTDGFARAGNVLETGLLSAIRRGSLGFDDLKRVALQTLGEIGSQAVRLGIGSLLAPAPQASGGLGAILAGAAGALFGLPGRATGGPVAPGRPYLVGERGPEMFVPTSAGQIHADGGERQPREVRVSIQLAAQRGSDAPAALKRSARQIASSVRRSLRDF